MLARQCNDLKQEQELIMSQHCDLAKSHSVAKLRLKALKEELGAARELYKESYMELASTKSEWDRRLQV